MPLRALVVGGTAGIGYAMACRIAAEAKTGSVIISGRTKPATLPHPNMEFRALDATSMRAIKQYTDQLKREQAAKGEGDDGKLDLLVLTQGILSMAGRTETPGGEAIDRKMALHYYGRQLLIRELAPALKDDARVVVVLDAVNGSPSKLNWDDLDLKTHFSIANAASHCISMTDAMVQLHAKQLQSSSSSSSGQHRHFIHAYPGIVNTSIAKNMPWFIRPVATTAARFLATPPDKCAEHMLDGTAQAVADGEKQGRYWSCIDAKGHVVANKAIWTDEQLAKIGEHTWKIVDDAIAAGGE